MNFHSRNCEKNNSNARDIRITRWHARLWKTKNRRLSRKKNFSSTDNGDCEWVLSLRTGSAFVNFRESIYFLRCTQFSTGFSLYTVGWKVKISRCFHESSVTRRDAILFARALNRARRWKFLTCLRNMCRSLEHIYIYNWHWESIDSHFKILYALDRLEIAGQLEIPWRSNNSIVSGFKFLQSPHFFPHSRHDERIDKRL